MTITALTNPKQPEWDDAATYFRELAERFERGEISECIVVLNDREGQHFERWAHFDDRWRALGALEHAKSAVLSGD